MAEKITIRDIARFAGVSKATVSRVLNQKPDVDPDTRERILRIMEEQAFLPSITAARLAGGRSRLIGVLIPSLTWPLIPEIMRGVSEMVIQTPYELLLYSITHEQDRNEKDQGYCEALSEAGITPDPTLVIEGDFMPSGGRACAGKLLALEDRPNAIFAASDQMAYGALQAAEEYGLRVPEDLSLIGFDDIPLSAHTRPALTTVRQPFHSIGQRAIELLLSLLESPRPVNQDWYPDSLQTYASFSSVKPSEPTRIQ